MSKTYSRSQLTGGTAEALDGIDGANLLDGDRAIVVTSEWSYIYSLDEDSGAVESLPQIIKPDINADNKRWILSKYVEYISTLNKRQVFIQSDQPTDGESNVGDLWIDIT
jgi:hypothetical protein